MARGWESKSVENQISEREADGPKSKKTKITAKQRELEVKRNGLLLVRTRTLSAIQSAHSESYRQQQERALAHLDAELAALETTNHQA